jgi:Rrf2 family transcriptional regulator, cysteine metabolism repressor
MMKVSTRSTYAIRALVYLGRNTSEGPVRLATIAEKQRIPLPYLEQIFSKLRRAHLVEAVRGPQGGYKLARVPGEISLADIIRSLEGPIEPVLCSMPENRAPDCHDVDGCISRHICSELDGELTRVLTRNTLKTLCGEADRLQRSTIPIRLTT